MPADTAQTTKLPPFRPLPYKGPNIEVTRGEGGVVYLRSREPMGPVGRSIPHILDDRAKQHPDRPWLKQRALPSKPRAPTPPSRKSATQGVTP